MSWGTLKAAATLDWTAEWRDLARMTIGEFEPSALDDVVMQLLNLNCLYARKDRPGFVAAKAQLKESLHAIGKGNQETDSHLPQQPAPVLCAGEAQQSFLEGLAGCTGEPERPYSRL